MYLYIILIVLNCCLYSGINHKKIKEKNAFMLQDVFINMKNGNGTKISLALINTFVCENGKEESERVLK